MALNQLLTSDGRRAAALLFMAGGGIAMTVYAGFALYFVRNNPYDVLTLGIAAHLSVLVVLTGFAGLLVKRMIKANVAGASFEASDNNSDPAAAAQNVVAGAIAAAAAATQEQSK